MEHVALFSTVAVLDGICLGLSAVVRGIDGAVGPSNQWSGGVD
jgi:hypothetical protein